MNQTSNSSSLEMNSSWTTVERTNSKRKQKKGQSSPTKASPSISMETQSNTSLSMQDEQTQQGSNIISSTALAAQKLKELLKINLHNTHSEVSTLSVSSLDQSMSMATPRFTKDGDVIVQSKSEQKNKTPIGAERIARRDSNPSLFMTSFESVDFTPFYSRRLEIPNFIVQDFIQQFRASTAY